MGDAFGGMSAHEIYVALTQGPGSDSLQGANRTAKSEAELEAERCDLISKIAHKTETGWQGQASAAAVGASRPLAVVSMLGAANLQKTDALLDQQTSGFHKASTTVVPVAENPPETGFLDDVSPWDTDTEDEQARYQAESEHNIRVYQQYDDQSLTNEMALPMDYSYLDDPGGSISVTPPNGPGGGPGEGEGGPWTPPRPPGTTDPRDPLIPVLPPDRPVDPRELDKPTHPSIIEPPQTTRPNEYIPQHTDTQQGRQPVNVTPSNPQNSQLTGLGLAGTGTGGGSGGGTRGGGSGGSRSGGSGGTGGSRGAGGAGAGTGAGARGAGVGSGADQHGPGGRSGAIGAEPHGAGGRAGAAGGRGGAGAGGGMGGGGRGKGEDDDEHTTASYLQEADPEAIFGTDQITAPPVIGE
jgi:hypothetical protein